MHAAYPCHAGRNICTTEIILQTAHRPRRNIFQVTPARPSRLARWRAPTVFAHKCHAASLFLSRCSCLAVPPQMSRCLPVLVCVPGSRRRLRHVQRRRRERRSRNHNGHLDPRLAHVASPRPATTRRGSRSRLGPADRRPRRRAGDCDLGGAARAGRAGPGRGGGGGCCSAALGADGRPEAVTAGRARVGAEAAAVTADEEEEKEEEREALSDVAGAAGAARGVAPTLYAAASGL